MMSAFFTLIRFPNLLMIAFTQYVMRYAVILPLVRSHSVEFRLSGFDFFCLVFSTMCTAAAGYAINDYFDVKTDNINRPNKVVVGRKISRRRTMMTHIIFCAPGILLGGYVTWKSGIPELALLYIMVAGMLWLYSTIYKQRFLIGNIIVALFSALVPMMVLLDIPPIYRASGQLLLDEGANLDFAVLWILGVAVFAFLTTLSREIIKDAEDFEGDAVYGCRSLPIVLGDRCTKRTIIGINIATVVALGIVYSYFLHCMAGCFSFFYILLLLVVPIIFISWKIHKAVTSDDYRRAGDWMKPVMLAGIAYSGVVWFAMG
ncbi:MAG: geranylgeranylglycerol-phosphate geranylgeranyltransferase [Bacteroidales bacterium]|jgi:4-hydroxybenzoate polyprenyltransferase|nr:geranylgeranylglycerol-phosphate geranylgeranyltransferase [Bacteroidales bacterium]